MAWWHGIILSLCSTTAYCLLFNVPVRVLPAGGAVGVIGWIVFSLSPYFGASQIMATFLAAITLSLVSQILSIYMRVPSTNFSISGIIPLVPGSIAYKAMLSFVNGDNLGGITLSTQTFLLAGAIASGLIMGVSIFSLWKGIVMRNALKRTKAN
ncbi:threonine/serine exporter family protein [Brevibacillus fulvus]|uniref:Uncharacterized membrane protein YjjB (DUF3815 family) n=1 Tax=Brevibacillus fulvus TaxID=1125967 RepID=A0A938Y2X9_9BACL|nr:uncharacterized membrane protein YjjB (DUF3815 family) [Brevibacillus fulvus]